MKAVIQNYRTGELSVMDLPRPAARPGGVLVRTGASLVSAGTERLMVELARKSLLGKARRRPDLVRKAVEKARRDGILTTAQTVLRRLDEPVPLGYSSAGTVIEVGEGAGEFRTGDRVACAGAGYAGHAEVVWIPRNLAAKLPEGVDVESGAFTTVGAVALQGLRLAEPQLGETVAVIGLGLLGLLTVQLARAAGCRVLGMDPEEERCRLAVDLGAEQALSDGTELAAACARLTAARGADRVVITAGTAESGPVRLAGELARDRGVVVAVGAVGMEIPRETYYRKELTLRVSRSYGPGRYDPEYEEKGHDYPAAYVRWTENRNMEAFAGELARGTVKTAPLVSHRFRIEDALEAYELITGGTGEPYLGVVLTYGEGEAAPRTLEVGSAAARKSGRREAVRLGVLGAGSFAMSVLLPVMRRTQGVELAGVCSASGLSARKAADKFGFAFATSDEREILDNPEVEGVAVLTRHNLHAGQVVGALEAGKHVFVEKPLCVSREELKAIERTWESIPEEERPVLMVGYNRRFAAMALRMREFMAGAGEPLVMHYRVNAGFVPPGHWVHDPKVGGGRVVGEVCHFVDFLMFLCGSVPVGVTARGLPGGGLYRNDNLQATLEFADGSLGTITYVANGDTAYPKERVEAFGGGRVAVLDNFRRLELVGNGRREIVRARLKQDKGYAGEWAAFVAAARRGLNPVPFQGIAASTAAVLDIEAALRRARA